MFSKTSIDLKKSAKPISPAMIKMSVSIIRIYLFKRIFIFKNTRKINDNETSHINTTTRASEIDCLLNFITNSIAKQCCQRKCRKFYSRIYNACNSMQH